jgi:hypothetical protein
MYNAQLSAWGNADFVAHRCAADSTILDVWLATRKLRFVDSWHPYGALALMTPHPIRAPELPAGSVL